jgi:diguanylate cyclase (GGDEF)-like protein/putative nucleotidyltransferase with HDIG domain
MEATATTPDLRPAHPRAIPRGAATLIGTIRGIAAGLVLIYAVTLLTGVGDHIDHGRVFHLATAAFLATAAVLCVTRAVLVASNRAAWTVVCLAFGSWAAGEVLFAVQPAGGPFSTPNLLTLAFYPLACLALALMLRAQLESFFTTLWLDGLAGALSVSALVAAFVFPPVLAGSGGTVATVVGALSYPLADLMLVAFVLFATAMTGWRPSGMLAGASAAFVVIAVTDAFSLWSAATTNSSRTELDWLWPAAALAVVEVAWRAKPPALRVSGTSLRLLVFPVVVSLTALGLLLSGLVHELDIAGYELAVSSLVLIVVRLALTVLENLQIADDSKREALTDGLTGLGNRRRLMLDVEAALGSGEATVLVLYDLDGFKTYNDTFGHPAGDALLERLGRELGEAVSKVGMAYRPGGDEFCTLLESNSSDLSAHIARTVAALSERGGGFSVAPSYGSVVIPHEASDVTLALQLADKRLYEQKGDRRRTRDGAQVRDVLMQALRERRPDLDDHLGGVASLAHAVAERLALNAEDVDEVTRAAELHDIGKMAVPDAILEKPASLDEREREMIRQHTIVGERILAVSPALRSVGKLVRLSHERWDGDGYPDGLIGDEIPLGARIIAVCDAFDAMTTDRPYQPAVPLDEALAELRRCAGTQFDPGVVEVFCQEAAELHAEAQQRRALDGGDPGLDALVLHVPDEDAVSSAADLDDGATRSS